MGLCKACRHRDHERIDAELVQGVAFRTIIAWSGLTLGCLSRHRNSCLKKLVQDAERAAHAASAEHGSELVDQLHEVVRAAKALVMKASEQENYATANSALNTIVRCAELLARASGELQTPGNVGGIHFHSTRISNTTVNVVTDDAEIAQLVAEATDGWNENTIARFKLLAPAPPSLSASDAAPDVPSQAAIYPIPSKT